MCNEWQNFEIRCQSSYILYILTYRKIKCWFVDLNIRFLRFFLCRFIEVKRSMCIIYFCSLICQHTLINKSIDRCNRKTRATQSVAYPLAYKFDSVTVILDLRPCTSIGFLILLRTKWMLILECSQGCYRIKIRPYDLDLWAMTLQINRVPDSHKAKVCTKFGQNPLHDVDSRVFTRMLRKDGRTVALLYPFATLLARG